MSPTAVGGWEEVDALEVRRDSGFLEVEAAGFDLVGGCGVLPRDDDGVFEQEWAVVVRCVGQNK